MELFGFTINRKQQEQEPKPESFAPPVKDDGAIVTSPAAGAYGTFVDLHGTAKTEAQLVTQYRDMAQHHEVDSGIDDITNEAICNDNIEKIVELNLDETKLSSTVKNAIIEEFNEVQRILGFNKDAYEMFRRWYVDGRIYYHVIIDEKTGGVEGIKEMRYIDPRKIRKIREVKKVKATTNQPNAILYQDKNEYYIYNDKGFLGAREPGQSGYTDFGGNVEGLKIAKDAIIHITSGYMDKQNKLVLSYLHKAIKPLNQLTTLEDATLIYKLARAPERRIFYIDVGDLPKGKAEQYMKDIMARFKNKLVYDSTTGEIRDDRKFMTLLEDFWFPRRGAQGKGTEVTTLNSQVSLTNMDELSYFKNNLYRSLNIPVSRTNTESTFSLGRATEITRDEIKFHKFVTRLRLRFAQLFTKTLEKQLILKRILAPEEWDEIVDLIKYVFAEDNYFAELKEIELMRERVSVVNDMGQMIGRFYSNEWVRKNILRQTDEDIEEMDKQMTLELVDTKYQMPLGGAAGGGQPGQPGQPGQAPPPGAGEISSALEIDNGVVLSESDSKLWKEFDAILKKQ